MSSVVQRAVKKLMDEGTWNGAYLTLRNIAVAHPALVLRHLNTLAALVEGRVQPSQVRSSLLRTTRRSVYLGAGLHRSLVRE
jgi:hypothetical protein